MKAVKLNVYADCTSEEPTKSYTVRRILFKTAKELGTLQEESKNATDDDQQIEITRKMLKCVVPDFKDEDLDGIDPAELGAFFRELGAEIHEVVKSAAKN